jgi:hypothetical protein
MNDEFWRMKMITVVCYEVMFKNKLPVGSEEN